MKYVILIVLALLALGGGTYVLLKGTSDSYDAPASNTPPVTNESTPDDTTTIETEPVATPLAAVRQETIGTSVDGNAITAYHFGTGSQELVLIGGVHGGYSVNTVELADQLRAYYESNVNTLPENVTVTVIPVLNPDGLKATTGLVDLTAADGSISATTDVVSSNTNTTVGRFNANTVDLNRNFDCDWQATSMWRNTEVSGGASAFSEPEAAALKNYMTAHDPAAVVVWFSAEGKVYPGTCNDASNTASIALADTFAGAADYPTENTFDAYQVNGDMVNWMTKIGVPAISVLLTNHTSTEFAQNLAGVQAIITSMMR